jgi:hypothetical protein
MGGRKILHAVEILGWFLNYRLYRKPAVSRAGLRTGINSIRLTRDAAGNLYGTTSQAGT